MAIIDTLRQLRMKFRASTMLMKIIWINIGVFVLLRLSAIAGIFAGSPEFINTVLSYVQLPSSLPLLLTRPWTLVTYMFAQYDLLHLAFNLLWLYWFGSLFAMVATKRQLLALYFLGGLGGALFFLSSYNSLPLFHGHLGWLIGSSASVIAIVTATAILMPDFRMNLLFIGSISLKWIAVATIAIVLLGVTGSNAGGEVAHIGGVAVGALYALRLKRGHDITGPFNRVLDRMANLWNRFASTVWGSFASRPKKTPHSDAGRRNNFYERRTYASPPPGPAPKCDDNDREALDEILDKIKKSGYAGLTTEERKKLFDVSRKIK